MAKDLEATEQMKNDFISRVSHELRTPLTAIKGWAETMQMDGFNDKRTLEKGMGIIIKETERLGGIVEEVLDFSRIQQDRMVLIMDKLDILAELDESVYMLRERANSENKHIVYDEPEILPIVLGDRNRLRQVFINIIDNALKYSDKEGVVTINAEETDGQVIIVIADNGCGISAKDLPKVKQKFYKANQTVRGSGIGLAVADEIVKLHNGTLDIDSTEGVGTTVTIKIPVLIEEKEDSE
jgi:signal transduction histidine kinase